MKQAWYALKGLWVMGCFVLFYSCGQEAKKDSEAETAVKEDSSVAQLNRGKYLATHVMLCTDCHSYRDFDVFAGPVEPGTEGVGGERFGPEIGVPGIVYGRNITPTGIAGWTDDDLITAITSGKTKEGDTLFPMMPYFAYSRMQKQDLLDIIAYVRTFKPLPDTVKTRQLFIPISVAAPQLPPPFSGGPAVDTTDAVKYGQYLVTMASCSDCHTPMVKGAPDMSKFVSGGHEFKLPGYTVNSSNITPDSATGIGTWTEAMFLDKFRENAALAASKNKPGKSNTIMPWEAYAGMKSSDLKAIYAFLRTVKPVSNKVVKWPGL